jgi:hypothetical protein
VPQEARLRRRLQEPRDGFEGGLTQRRLTKRSLELRSSEVPRMHHAPTSDSVKLHSWVTVIGQQRTEVEPGRLGVFVLTYVRGAPVPATGTRCPAGAIPLARQFGIACSEHTATLASSVGPELPRAPCLRTSQDSPSTHLGEYGLEAYSQSPYRLPATSPGVLSRDARSPPSLC